MHASTSRRTYENDFQRELAAAFANVTLSDNDSLQADLQARVFAIAETEVVVGLAAADFVTPTDKYYVVFIGRRMGVFRTWEATHLQTSGFRHSSQRSFNTLYDARAAWHHALQYGLWSFPPFAAEVIPPNGQEVHLLSPELIPVYREQFQRIPCRTPLIGEDQPPMYETPSSPTTVFSVQTPSLGSSLEYAEETMSRPFGGPPPWSSNDLSRSETSTASPSAQQTPGTSRRTEKLPASDQAPGTSRRAEKLPAFDRAMGQSPSPSFIDICKKEKKPVTKESLGCSAAPEDWYFVLRGSSPGIWLGKERALRAQGDHLDALTIFAGTETRAHTLLARAFQQRQLVKYHPDGAESVIGADPID